MKREIKGKVVKGLGGLFEILTEDGKERFSCRAKGALKRDEEKLLIGDNVRVTVDDETPDGVVISEILPRKNSLIRPPLANLDMLFMVFAAAKPTPVLETVDKLISIAEHNYITPVIVITKSDLSDDGALAEFSHIYERAGYDVFVTSSETGEGIDTLSAFVKEKVCGGTLAAFAGASGVGKSTIMNSLFPGMSLATSEISRKIERGRHTTRHVEIFEIGEGGGFLADTPGFSLLDFERFDFFDIDELLPTFKEIAALVGKCRYADCAHVGEGVDECEIARAAADGRIGRTRLDSYRAIYNVLKAKNKYK